MPQERRGRPPARAALRGSDPEGFQSFAGRHLDRRVAGFLCEEREEAADPAVEERFRGASLGNYKAAVRLWVDAFGNRPLKAYIHAEGREFIALLGRVPAGHGKGRHVPVREAIRLADEQERRAIVEIAASGASPGAPFRIWVGLVASLGETYENGGSVMKRSAEILINSPPRGAGEEGR